MPFKFLTIHDMPRSVNNFCLHNSKVRNFRDVNAIQVTTVHIVPVLNFAKKKTPLSEGLRVTYLPDPFFFVNLSLRG